MKKLLKSHTMGFEPWGVVLFIAIMLPNILWMLVPAPVDVLRKPSVTPVIDGFGSFFQMLMAFCLCTICRTDAKPVRLSPIIWAVIGCVVVYWVAWACYYAGITHAALLMAMALLPCAAFVLFLIQRRNWIGLAPAVAFTVCHLLFAIVNHLVKR